MVLEFCGRLNCIARMKSFDLEHLDLGVSGLSLHCVCFSSVFRIARTVPASNEDRLMRFATSNCTYDCRKHDLYQTLSLSLCCSGLPPHCDLSFNILPCSNASCMHIPMHTNEIFRNIVTNDPTPHFQPTSALHQLRYDH